MQLIQRTTLLYQSGKSDKVYEADICQVEDDRYVVNFRYGRRGKALREGSQTDAPVPRAEAQKVFDKLIAAKTKKGYQDVTGQDLDSLDPAAAVEPAPAAHTAADPAITQALASQREAAILARLAQGDTNGDQPPWSLSRAIWRSGELRISAAAPLLIQLLGPDPLQNPPMRNYCLAWALGNCGDAAAINPLEDLYDRSTSPAHAHVKRIALAALLKLVSPAQAADWQARLIQTLPGVLQTVATEASAEEFAAVLATELQNPTLQQVQVLTTLYQINSPHMRSALFETLGSVPLRPPYFQVVRHIFKLAEYRQDAEMFGRLAYRFEQEDKGYTGNDWYISLPNGEYIHRYTNQEYNYKTGRWEHDENPDFKAAFIGPNAKIAFGEKTKNYLRRRVWKTLKRLGELADTAYVSLATEILLQYADQDAQDIRNRILYRWDNNWQQVEAGRAAWDKYAAYWAFNHILYTHSPRYAYKHPQNAWRCQNGYKPGDPAPTIREEAFPELWTAQPHSLLRLLLESRCGSVHEFAVRALKTCAEFCPTIELADLVKLLRQPYAETAEFAFGLAHDRYAPQNPNLDLVLAVANCAYAPARSQAYIWITAQRDRFLSDGPLVAALIVSPEAETRAFVRQLLSTATPLPEALSQVIVGQVIAILLVLQEAEIERMQNTIDSLLDYFAAPMRSLGIDIIVDLLRQPLEVLQVFGATLLRNHITPAAEFPPGLLDALIESPTDAVRVLGVEIFGTLPDTVLEQQPQQLMTLATHELPEMRDAIQPTLVRLLNTSSDFINQFLPHIQSVLQQPEPHAGVHDFLVKLIGQDVTRWMAAATSEQTWQLLQCESTAAQELAGHMLQSRRADWQQQLTIFQMGELTHHEIQTVRSAGCQMIQSGLSEIRQDSEKLLTTVMVLESPWDDVRQFGFQFFTEQLQPEDFTPSLIVSICDNNLPEIRKLGRDLLSRCFHSSDGPDYLLKFSQHPAPDMQLFATNYLERYAADAPDRLRELQPYFTIVLGQVNRNRVAKQRIFRFLAAEATKSETAAAIVAAILTRQSAAITIRDKSQAIEILLQIQQAYPTIETLVKVQPVAVRAS
ncbi:WGR domain-containing protein [filamentous cyanobacterium LEGE 11480]|uniref:WGR domain-containing protein n=1 Tax=Romeriopsis navalis LEGE 11480 TaxID=2777977 RepID=A0A928VNH6_9CYAN|nr:WGR domain-containing protein [Romeriopsis navalis]MBE9029951.1 WGR domain-containing protein [Romeriopsis navalis LEGE 11480]